MTAAGIDGEAPCPQCGFERDSHTDAQAEACGEAEQDPARPSHCWTCGARDCERGSCPGPAPDDDIMLTARDAALRPWWRATEDLADHEAIAHSGLISSRDV